MTNPTSEDIYAKPADWKAAAERWMERAEVAEAALAAVLSSSKPMAVKALQEEPEPEQIDGAEYALFNAEQAFDYLVEHWGEVRAKQMMFAIFLRHGIRDLKQRRARLTPEQAAELNRMVGEPEVTKSQMTAQELKDKMLDHIEHVKEGRLPDNGLTDKDIFLLEHFVRSFPTSVGAREGEVK